MVFKPNPIRHCQCYTSLFNNNTTIPSSKNYNNINLKGVSYMFIVHSMMPCFFTFYCHHLINLRHILTSHGNCITQKKKKKKKKKKKLHDFDIQTCPSKTAIPKPMSQKKKKKKHGVFEKSYFMNWIHST
jgi:hypothetical protein